jgi:hypothetical protein
VAGYPPIMPVMPLNEIEVGSHIKYIQSLGDAPAK